ncbi:MULTISPECIES: GTP-binding protein [Exiguobacterium]|jgi:G3E family GTPase|uniref:CobW family GTP-binding protein n=1 Tax=Exiguobacterium TaxID=33986 RepID=UPI000497BBF9|nr:MULTISPECIES: GTP-binding protein [Exiguobacterium]TCI74075.1 GTP-binding protein [Exiguobacterium sp. IPCI3]TCI83231.1 GTP-binding protein [Exiguobacterium sp. IPCH1]TCI84285.1 GTP-binding protein [Exiguobacterium sp. IPBC4]
MIPVQLVTGFLGAGKTTYMNRLLEATDERLLVIVNELGSVNIDEQLIVKMDQEQIELSNGCICCSIQSDLSKTFYQLASKDTFDRIVIETTGVADPAPIIQTIYYDDYLRTRFKLTAILTVVDASQLDRELFIEGIHQIAYADVILLNKVDLVDADALEQAHERINALNPTVRVIETVQTVGDYDLTENTFQLSRIDEQLLGQLTAGHSSVSSLRAITLTTDVPLKRERVTQYVREVLMHYEDDVYRLKAIVRLDGETSKFVVQATNQLMGATFANEPSDDSRSVFVWIGKNLDRDALTRGLQACEVNA